MQNVASFMVSITCNVGVCCNKTIQNISKIYKKKREEFEWEFGSMSENLTVFVRVSPCVLNSLLVCEGIILYVRIIMTAYDIFVCSCDTYWV